MPERSRDLPSAPAVNLAPKIAESANGLRAFDFMICLRDCRDRLLCPGRDQGSPALPREFVQTRSSVSGRFFCLSEGELSHVARSITFRKTAR